MSIHHITAKDFIEMTWKNGLGTTYQIDLESLHNQWLWRISMALIDKENTFSEFKNYNRLLTVLDGNGVWLNQKLLQPKQITFFHGEEIIQCRPISGKVKDLGVIYDRERVSVNMEHLIFANDQEKVRISHLYPINFIYCQQGEAIYGHQRLCKQELIKITHQSEITFSSIAKNTELFLIKILSCLDWGK